MLRRAFACLLVPAALGAQTGYYNLDAGRPTRVEDATPTPRGEIELQLASLRFERSASGMERWRAEPKIAVGVAPFTEIEIRAPFLVIFPADSSVRVKSGVGGVAIGAMHAFGLERRLIPAVAVSGEFLAPVGSFGGVIGSYSLRGIATKTFRIARVHVNGAYGTYSVRPAADDCTRPRADNEPRPPGCARPTFPPDPPCDRVPMQQTLSSALLSAQCISQSVSIVPEAFDPTRSVGMRWMAGIGLDHAFALSSTLVSADIVAERYAGLFAETDIGAEIGIRHQWSPQLVLDAGVARHFMGPLGSTSITVGMAFGLPIPRRLR